MTTLSVSDAIVGKYTLSVTTRDGGDTTDMLSELTYRTIKAWLWIVAKLEQGETVLPLTEQGDMRGSVEEGLHKEFIDHDGDLFPPLPSGDARVTVWDTFKSQSRIGFHLNSDDIPQIAINTWLANHKAIERILAEQPPMASQPRQDTPNSSATPSQAPTTPPAPNGAANPPLFMDGAIVASRLPTPSTPQYADGQIVSFTIVKIEASADKGSPTFKLWSSLGGKYPSHTIYKLDTKGQVKKDYEAMLPVLNALKLDFEHPEAKGTWRLVVRAQHAEKDGKTKEYQNLVSITPI